MKTALVVFIALLACHLERVATHAPEEQAANDLRLAQSTSCNLVDPDHRHPSPYHCARGMLAHGVAFEKDDATDLEFRLVSVSDRGGLDRFIWDPPRARREPFSTSHHMLASASLRC
jgi:hypothetical protein